MIAHSRQCVGGFVDNARAANGEVGAIRVGGDGVTDAVKIALCRAVKAEIVGDELCPDQGIFGIVRILNGEFDAPERSHISQAVTHDVNLADRRFGGQVVIAAATCKSQSYERRQPRAPT